MLGRGYKAEGNAGLRKCSGVLETIGIATAYFSIFVYLELLRAQRSPYWQGLQDVNWLGVAAGFVIYFTSLVVVILLLNALASGVGRLSPIPRPSMPIAGGVGGLTIWMLLAATSDISRSLTAAITMTLLVCGICMAYLPRFWSMTLSRSCIWFSVAFATATFATVALTDIFFLHHDRAFIVTCSSLASLAIVGFGIATALRFRGVRAQRRLAYGIVAFGVAVFATFKMISPMAVTQPGGEIERSNLVLVTCDALRSDYCSPYGGRVSMPVLEKLAERGATFTRSYALAPWTIPSFYGMLTSTYPPGTQPGTTDEQQRREKSSYLMQNGVRTLSEKLQSEGYTTGAFSGNYFLSDRDGPLRGFGYTRWLYHYAYPRGGLFESVPFLNAFLSRVRGMPLPPPVDSTRLLSNYATAFLRRHGHEPFFLWVHYLDPHDPYNPPESYRTDLPNDPVLGSWLSFYIDRAELQDEQRAYARELYAREIEYVDRASGEIVAELERLGLMDSTYVCVTSDHGEEFWDHGAWGHGQSVHEELLRVPLVITGPGIPAQTIGEAVSAIDLTPTLADLVGVSPEPTWRGSSWAPYLRGDRSELSPSPCFAHATTRGIVQQAVIEDEFKLIRDVNRGVLSLYNLTADPGEWTNIAADHPAIVRDLGHKLDVWLNTFSSTIDAPANAPLTPEQEERIRELESVGYL